MVLYMRMPRLRFVQTVGAHTARAPMRKCFPPEQVELFDPSYSCRWGFRSGSLSLILVVLLM